jgi:hypothetical protein
LPNYVLRVKFKSEKFILGSMKVKSGKSVFLKFLLTPEAAKKYGKKVVYGENKIYKDGTVMNDGMVSSVLTSLGINAPNSIFLSIIKEVEACNADSTLSEKDSRILSKLPRYVENLEFFSLDIHSTISNWSPPGTPMLIIPASFS